MTPPNGDDSESTRERMRYYREQRELNRTPGSPEAVKAGCLCPVIDNCRGKGYYAGLPGDFVMNEACPLHGKNGGRK